MKKIIIPIVAIVLIAAVIFGIINFIIPIDAEITAISYIRMSNNPDKKSNISLEDYFKRFSDNFNSSVKNDSISGQLLTDYEQLPSDDPDDYIEIKYYINVNNKSLFDINGGNILFNDINDETKFFLESVDAPIPYEVNKNSSAEWVMHYCAAYVGDLSDDEIAKKLKNVELQLTYDVVVTGARSTSVRADNAKVTEVKEW